MPSFSGVFVIVILLLYLLPIIGVIYWMVKMLNNSNENLRINREILRKLEEKP
jgi:CHASE3 domain sensor protein